MSIRNQNARYDVVNLSLTLILLLFLFQNPVIARNHCVCIMLLWYYYKVCRSRMTKDSCFSFIIGFCISSGLLIRAEFTNLLQEIEILEDEILTPSESVNH